MLSKIILVTWNCREPRAYPVCIIHNDLDTSIPMHFLQYANRQIESLR